MRGGVSNVRWRAKQDAGKQERSADAKRNLRAKQFGPRLVKADSVEFDHDRAITDRSKRDFELSESLPLRA